MRMGTECKQLVASKDTTRAEARTRFYSLQIYCVCFDASNDATQGNDTTQIQQACSPCSP